MELNFIKNAETNAWEAEFEASSDFNLHIEGVVEGKVEVYQRGTSTGKYALAKNGTPTVSYGSVYDYDLNALVYPKYIKVVCPNEPTYAEVTFA